MAIRATFASNVSKPRIAVWSRFFGRLQTGLIALGWLLITTPGCVSIGPSIMTQRDYQHYNSMSLDLDHQTYVAQTPNERVANFPPRTVADPTDKKKWLLSLDEVNQIALKSNKQVLVYSMQPGQAGSGIEARLAEFDAYFSVGGDWGRSNTPLTSSVNVAGSGQSSLVTNTFGNSTFSGTSLTGGISSAGFGTNTTTGGATQDTPLSLPGQDLMDIVKKTATGGTAQLSYGLGYTRQSRIGLFTLVNPAWNSVVTASVRQPLLQGGGVEYNRANIQIARANYDQSIRVFEQVVQTMLRDVESAYWQLGFTYYDLYSREVGLEQALITWRKVRAEVEVGRSAIPDLAQAREQFEFFRADRLSALQRLLTAERNLRLSMGIPPEDNRQIVPIDAPVLAQYKPDWGTAAIEAVSLRPEIVAQTFVVRAAELELFRQKNGLMPDLSVSASYSLTGLGNEFDKSIVQLTDGNFQGWMLGIRYARQIGERAANAAVRSAQLNLEQEKKNLDFLRHTAIHELTDAYRNIMANYQLIDVQGERRRAAATQLQARAEQYRTGQTTLDELLDAQSFLADAIRDEGSAIAQYNQSLIQWEFAKGTILNHNSVNVGESVTNRANTKLISDRKKMWKWSLPLPMHEGSQVHKDFPDCPNPDQPFYPSLANTIGEVKEADASTTPANPLPLPGVGGEPIAPEQTPVPSDRNPANP